MSQHDELYLDPARDNKKFVFDNAVSEVFADMINRSVPGYTTLLGMLSVIAENYIQADSNIYDLGCSQGGATIAVGTHTRQKNCTLIAVDNAPAMIEKCHKNLSQVNIQPSIKLLCDDIQNVPIENASLVVLNLTLQFVDRTKRANLLSKIRAGMLPGGAVMLAEKTISNEPTKQAFLTKLHHDFKRANGYSDMEISRKRTALENVLVPDSHETHLSRLKGCGFSQAYLWFSCVGFNAYLAIADD